MTDIISIIKNLSLIDSPSGCETNVRNYIKSYAEKYCDCHTDKLGNLICEKKGKNPAVKRLMLDAHMDEVGVIVTNVNDTGKLKFQTVGGVEPAVLMGRRIKFGETVGVVECTPVHLLKGDAESNIPKVDDMLIDIGAEDKAEAEKAVKCGDFGVFESDFVEFGNGFIKSKALDDRVGCAVLMVLMAEELPYDMVFSFSVQEEVGLIGARAAAYSIKPDSAIVVETTTAADIAGSTSENDVCCLGQGPVISFMDKATLYNQNYVNAALDCADDNGISAQPKRAVAGGNNAGSIHSSIDGVATVAVSVPCRYLHSAVCVVNKKDITETVKLIKILSGKIAGGEISAF